MFGFVVVYLIVWYVDNIDSYFYNLIFWLRGFKESLMFDCIMVVLVGFDGFVKLYFDDIFMNCGI